MPTRKLRFETYAEKYFDSCVELIMSTWDFHSNFVNAPCDRIIYEYYLKTCLNWNQHFDLILDSKDQVKGLLFGSKEEISYLDELKFARRDIQTNKWKNKKIQQGHFGDKEVAKKELSRFTMNDALGEVDACLFGGEINLFIVSPELRGKGLGTELMDRYMEFCKRNKLKSIFLWTDEDCNYRFYSRYGFSLYKRFSSYTHYKKKSPTENGMIFSFQIS